MTTMLTLFTVNIWERKNVPCTVCTHIYCWYILPYLWSWSILQGKPQHFFTLKLDIKSFHLLWISLLQFNCNAHFVHCEHMREKMYTVYYVLMFNAVIFFLIQMPGNKITLYFSILLSEGFKKISCFDTLISISKWSGSAS